MCELGDGLRLTPRYVGEVAQELGAGWNEDDAAPYFPPVCRHFCTLAALAEGPTGLDEGDAAETDGDTAVSICRVPIHTVDRQRGSLLSATQILGDVLIHAFIRLCVI